MVESLPVFQWQEAPQVKSAIKIDPLNKQRVSANLSRSPGYVATNAVPARVQSPKTSASPHVVNHVITRRSHLKVPSPRWTWRPDPRQAQYLRRFLKNMSTTRLNVLIARPHRCTPPLYGVICCSSGSLLPPSAGDLLQGKEVRARKTHLWRVSCYLKINMWIYTVMCSLEDRRFKRGREKGEQNDPKQITAVHWEMSVNNVEWLTRK